MRSQPRRVCVVIVSYNHATFLPPCLNALDIALGPDDTAIIIENNPSSDASINKLATEFPQYRWIFNTENRGFTGGNHQGTKWALEKGFQYMFLLNPDTELAEDCLERLIAASKRLKDDWIIGPVLIKPGAEKDPIIDSAGLDWDRFYRAQDQSQGQRLSTLKKISGENIIPTNGLCGAAMMIPAKLFPLREEAAWWVFDESYFAYFEDMELSLYRQKKGGKFGVVANALVRHQRGAESRLGAITFNKWKANKKLIEKMILNRYRTIARYATRENLMRGFPILLLYEATRWLYIFLRKPYLLGLFFSVLKIFNSKNNSRKKET